MMRKHTVRCGGREINTSLPSFLFGFYMNILVKLLAI